MYDAASLSDAAALQRAQGVLSVRFALRGGVTALAGLRQEGCLKARFPHRADPSWAEVATVNTSGGVAGGDRLTVDVAVGAGARAVIATQAAERFYRARPGDPPALLRARIAVGPGAHAEWLPQETILFDGAALDRVLEVEMAGDAGFLGVEALVFGRAAMGEAVRRLWLRDSIRVRRDGVSMLHDTIRLIGDAAALLCRRAVAAGMGTAATVLCVAPEVSSRLDAVRMALADAEAGASAWNGMLVARIVSPDSASLRGRIARVLDVLRGRPLPRVWMC